MVPVSPVLLDTNVRKGWHTRLYDAIPPVIRAERNWGYLNHKWPMYVKLKTFLRFSVGKKFRNSDHVIKRIDFCDQKFRDFRLVRFFHWVEFDSTFVLFWTVFSFQSNFLDNFLKRPYIFNRWPYTIWKQLWSWLTWKHGY